MVFSLIFFKFIFFNFTFDGFLLGSTKESISMISKLKNFLDRFDMGDCMLVPNNLSELNKVVDTNVITIVDRIKNKNNITRISGHINRSGQNFLVGSTPYLDKPQFPDMSSLYGLRGNKKTTVHTIGRERYLSTERLNRKTVWSESIALVAIVFSYLGFTVEGFGVPDQKTNENTVQFIINNP